MVRSRPIVALDGPAGAGKSTVAQRLADTLSFVLVDTGAMYRAIALAAKRANVACSDGDAVGTLARSIVDRAGLQLSSDPGAGVRVRLDGDDVTDAIRTPEIGLGASIVSAHKPVRDALLDMQRRAGQAGGVVLEGRDIGTVVFPDAEVKFFLTARPEVRARRRFEQLAAAGKRVTFDEALEDVRRRDEQDTTRAIAPLKRAGDAILVDNSDISIDDTVRLMADHVRSKVGR